MKFGKIIGQGNVGCVYEGWWHGTHVAIKKLLGSWLFDETMVDRFREEISLMSTLHHPNILMFIGAVLDKSPDDDILSKMNTKESASISLVTEYCKFGRYD